MKTLLEKLGTLGTQLENGASTRADTLFQVRALLESELSHEEKGTAIYRALEAAEKSASDGSYVYRYIADIYDDYFVYEQRADSVERLFKRTYSIDAEGGALLGAATEVRREVNYVPATETAPVAVIEADKTATSAKPLREAFIESSQRFISEDGLMKLKIIDEGWGSSGYYSREILERDLATAFPIGTLMFANHATAMQEAEQPEGRIENIAAVFAAQPEYLADGPDGPGGYVDAKVFSEYRQPLSERAAHIGVSINAAGEYHIGEAAGRSGPIVDAITVGKSVDFVTRAGRGGKILPLQESLREGAASTRDDGDREKTEPPKPIQENSNSMSMNEQEEKTLREAQKKLETRNARLEERAIAREARDTAAAQLAAVEGLPAITRDRLAESLSDNPPVKSGDEGRELDRDAFKTIVEKAVENEIKYLAAITESGGVRGMGAAPVASGKAATKLNESAGLARTRAGMGL